MNYYKRHLGDYAKKAGHLTMLEHGAYNLILDGYYDRERPLSEVEAIRLARARTDEEIAAVRSVLAQFFFERDGHFEQARADDEIAHFHKRQKLNKKLGKLGGQANGKRIAKRNDSEGQASHKPLAISQKKEARKRATPLPDGFAVSERVKTWASERGHGRLAERLENFVGYAKRKGATYVDWDEALMCAIREDWAKLGAAPKPVAEAVPTCCMCHAKAVARVGGASYCSGHLPNQQARAA